MKKTLEELLYYGEYHLGLKKRDENYIRNLLMDKLKISDRYDGEIDKKAIEEMKVPDKFTEKLTEYIKANALCDESVVNNYVCAVFGLLTPPPSEVEEKFYALYKEDRASAFAYLFDLSIKNNYVQKTAVDRNIGWRADFPENYLEITINLSKPELNNKDIAKKLNDSGNTAYPKCALCVENEGFAGTATKAPRQNIRTIGIKLNGEDWILQYSPYQYYNEHCIAINTTHTYMKVDAGTFEKLFDFVDFYPDYFVGSNAPLPIVGGSILNHEHYQGGGHLMPLHFAKPRKEYKIDGFEGVDVSVTEWYNSVVHLEGTDRKEVARLATYVLEKYEGYSDESVDLIAETDAKHNTVTPIARIADGKYVLDLILRNNRCNEKYPEGIFHAHPQYHNIKKEGIGLIEAMGLFILPARLSRQMKEIEKFLCGKKKYVYTELPDDMKVHAGMIERLIFENGSQLSIDSAKKLVTDYVNNTCRNILINTAVFKPNDIGKAAFDTFMTTIGFTAK